MDTSVNATVGTAVALQQFNADQQAQTSLLKQALDTQASQMEQLMDSVTPQNQLATTGTVGTRINTVA
ncbi:MULTISPECIES: putative motility protein [Modicisalibacter]|uniref:putative motility protein n=1 Tax=Modicisalibacter TaxID=574347 RepID=UPI00100BBA91|nr:putative motility protein [Halomonas coralii]MBZ9560123.1 YjfB family protein [Modicisalibacter sp. R2A 31.J]MBZ9576031.1 YjfB family protein [Modicisalibacter sp. MOD 31.J]